MAPLVTGKTMQEDREQLQAERAASGEIREMQPKAVWDKADGSLVWPEGVKGPADPYHMKLFRAKGWTLAPPDQMEAYWKSKEKMEEEPIKQEKKPVSLPDKEIK